MEIESDEDMSPPVKEPLKKDRRSLTIHFGDDEIEDETISMLKELASEEEGDGSSSEHTPTPEFQTGTIVNEMLAIQFPQSSAPDSPPRSCILRLFRRVSSGRSGELLLGVVLQQKDLPATATTTDVRRCSTSMGSADSIYAVKKLELPVSGALDSDDLLHETAGLLRREISALCRLKHRNVVDHFTSFRTETTLYIVMQHCVGNLREVLRTVGPLNEALALMFTAQLLDGLYFLHRCGIKHRGVTPDNILIDIDEEVKTIQLCLGNLAKGLQCCVNQKEVPFEEGSAELDVWCLGCTVVEMLSGVELPRNIWAPSLDALAKVIPEIPTSASSAARQFVEWCLNDDQRSVTCEELLQSSWIVGGARGDAIACALNSPQYERLELLIKDRKVKVKDLFKQQSASTGAAALSSALPVRQGVGFAARSHSLGNSQSFGSFSSPRRTVRRVVIK